MNEKKENIILDAEITGVLSTSAFRAKLANGHGIVAFLRDRSDDGSHCCVGTGVQVEMSPFDMSKGRVLLKVVENHEST